MKVYVKRGQPSYKERRLISEIQAVIDKKIEKDPSFADTFEPASNYEELKNLHDKYCIEDAEFQEVDSKPNASSQSTPIEPEINNDDNTSFMDPFNREQPEVRDYVKENSLSQGGENKGPARTNFEEPTNFDEAFEMPSDEPGDNSGGGKSEPKEKKEPKKSEPINPAYNNLDDSQKSYTANNFSKYAVEAGAVGLESLLNWFGTKNINQNKLAQLELDGLIDLSYLITLENGEKATMRDFFRSQELAVAEISKISDEDKKALAKVLKRILDEKGFAPTPGQELAIICGKIAIEKGVAIWNINRQQIAILNQLKSMVANNETASYNNSYEQPRNETPQQPSYEPAETSAEAPVAANLEEEKTEEQTPVTESHEDFPIINNPIPTAE